MDQPEEKLTFGDSLAFIQKQFAFLPSHLTRLLVDLFLASGSINGTSAAEIRSSLADFIADSTFTCPTTLFANRMSQESGINMETYVYLFDEKTRRGGAGGAADWMGVMHFDEVPFVFGHPIRDPTAYTDAQVQLSRDILAAWVNFARFG